LKEMDQAIKEKEEVKEEDKEDYKSQEESTAKGLARPVHSPSKSSQFITTLISPGTPLFKKKELIMKYLFLLVSRPLPKYVKKLEFVVRRDRNGLSKKVYPRFDLTLASNSMFILASQKMNAIGAAHYNITTEWEKMDKETPGYLGKLRADLVGVEYNLFGVGQNPSTQLPDQMLREQFGAVYYVRI
jgi:hypothetical protein